MKIFWSTQKKIIRQTKIIHIEDSEPEKKEAASVDLQAAAAEAEIYQFLIIFLLSNLLLNY